MANKDLVGYIGKARPKMSDKEIFQNLKKNGWHDADIKDALSYVDLYDQRNPLGKSEDLPRVQEVARVQQGTAKVHPSRWFNAGAFVLGYLWILSGLNKILSGEFVDGFSDYLQSQLLNSNTLPFYKNFLSGFVSSNETLFAFTIQYAELAIGIILLLFGLINFFRNSRLLHLFLSLAFIGSFFLILNIILTSSIPLPFIDTANIYASAMSVEYVILFLSLFLCFAHYSQAGKD